MRTRLSGAPLKRAVGIDMTKILPLGCCLAWLSGCVSFEEQRAATIHFYSDVEPAAWVRNSAKVEWGLLFTTDDLVGVKENRPPNDDETYVINHPRYSGREFLNKMATVKGIKNRTNAKFAIAAGTYDWLVLVDFDGDTFVDGYVGTLASHGPLASHEFQAGKSYFIRLDKRGTLSFDSK